MSLVGFGGHVHISHDVVAFEGLSAKLLESHSFHSYVQNLPSKNAPPTAFEQSTKAQANWAISGHDCQIVAFALNVGEAVTCQPGAMVFTSENVKPHTSFAGCCQGLSGESFFKTVYKNEGEPAGPGYVGLAGNMPACLVPINLDEEKGIHAKLGAYICNSGEGVKMTLSLPFRNLSCGAACFATPFITQNIYGTGWAFIGANGTITEKVLKQGESES